MSNYTLLPTNVIIKRSCCTPRRYYGWQSLVVKDKVIPYDFLPFAQTVTKTKVYEVDSLPNRLSDDECEQFINRIKPQLEASLVFEYSRNRLVPFLLTYVFGSIVSKINLLLFRYKNRVTHLSEDIVDDEPTNELAKSVAEQVNRIFLSNLAADYPHLFEAQVCVHS